MIGCLLYDKKKNVSYIQTNNIYFIGNVGQLELLEDYEKETLISSI